MRLKVDEFTAARKLKGQLDVGAELLMIEAPDSGAADRLLAAVFDWHEMNIAVLREVGSPGTELEFAL